MRWTWLTAEEVEVLIELASLKTLQKSYKPSIHNNFTLGRIVNKRGLRLLC